MLIRANQCGIQHVTRPKSRLEFSFPKLSFYSMPCEVAARFLILYGSQRGQAQSIAEEICQQSSEHGLTADISCLSNQHKYNLDSEVRPVVFVVSTTGDGDPPDTAQKFVRKIKNKSLPHDHFSHLRYGLLALGDTNYANFCNGGKTIDGRLQQLGAKHFYATGHADDGTGLEVVVDPWIEGLWDALKTTFSSMAASDQQRADLSDCTKENYHKNASDQERNKSDLEVDLRLLKLSEADSQKGKVISSDSSDAETLSTTLVASLKQSLPPLSESALNVPALPASYLEVHLEQVPTEGETVSSDEGGYREVSISKAVQLTQDNAVKTTILLELDISEQNIAYQPGDAFDILCPNRASEVEELLLRLDLQTQKSCAVQVNLLKNSSKKAKVPLHIPQNGSLEFILTWCLEIRSAPKKAFVRALADFTENGLEKRRLLELCSKEGSSQYNSFVRDANVCLLDLLRAFPSCLPPLSLLFEHLPRLQPRAYSAASSSLQHPGKVHFVFSVVEFPARPEHPARTGLCTGWLTDHVSSILRPLGTAPASERLGTSALPKVHVRPRPSSTFHLPADSSVPVVMVGPGTGVAPFIGFLQQREKECEANAEATFGETWLFFGCRHKDKDFLFREELERFAQNGTLSHLIVCFSRDEPDAAGTANRPTYVQHNLRLHAKNVTGILLKDKGYLYVCGDAKNMAKDVNDTLLEIVGNELQIDKLDAMKTVAGFREEKRYLQDIWS
ncbi:methionine synthase reductase isoform X2 [Puntigrus tetrazona]|uniref:methionine synthase reductase isoform X2 n=1 Tax=Puntigrus tetrazona TaxID=1606681 RepID=UPI001C89318A|nr:methionine synthase reductase isoform X2 [Puntigrus tetrazona]